MRKQAGKAGRARTGSLLCSNPRASRKSGGRIYFDFFPRLRREYAGAAARSCGLGLAFAGLVDIADRRFIDQQSRSAVAVQLDAVAVIPLDASLHLFAVFHHHYHGGLTLDLLLVIVIFSMGLLRRAIA